MKNTLLEIFDREINNTKSIIIKLMKFTDKYISILAVICLAIMIPIGISAMLAPTNSEFVSNSYLFLGIFALAYLFQMIRIYRIKNRG